MTDFGKRRGFLVRQEQPFNGGPPLDEVGARFVTPNDLFFVRNHGDVPEVDLGTFRLEVRGDVERPLSLAFAELDRYPRREITATLQCAGNRRQELIDWKPIPHELPWGSEAISTAVWRGISLADVLAEAGHRAPGRHVAFCGLDDTERHGKRFHYGGSIPLAKALDPDVLLATEMNGEPLPPTHGYPLRVVVPGWIGARSVKWLHRIEVCSEPSDNYFQSVAYRLFPADVDASTVVWENGMRLGEQAVNALVTSPADGTRHSPGSVRVAGVALAGGDRTVERVELSCDGGVSWLQAELSEEAAPWAWRQWRVDVDLAAGSHELVVRAWDSAAQTMPPAVDQVWNFKGYMNNSWCRLRLEIG
ncbi:MAG: sulfite oxidase [Thermoanaerobaculia bacterium]